MSRAYYERNKEACKARAREHYARNRERVQAQRDERRAICDKAKDVPCMDCGVRYPPVVMDFDHRDPTTKKFGIGARARNTSNEQLLEEIAKCDVVCANCHRLRTHSERIYA